MPLLLALASAKRAGELTALSVSPICLLLNGDISFTLLRPKPMFLPQNIASYFQSWDIEHLLCLVRMYMQRTAATQQLFVCYSDAARGRTLSKQRLSRWLCEAICLYTQQGWAPPLGVRAHSTWSVAVSIAVLRGVLLEDICAAALWALLGTLCWSRECIS